MNQNTQTTKMLFFLVKEKKKLILKKSRLVLSFSSLKNAPEEIHNLTHKRTNLLNTA